MENIFPAKLLLFGEYTILNGSQALAIPFYQWQGKWKQHQLEGHISIIPEYYRWLHKVELINDEVLEKISCEFRDGWMYDSDIPVGYGVGSSGAYVAAIYDRYLKDMEQLDFQKTIDKLAQMESFFHGSSSGMDPLVSFSKKAIYKDDHGQFHPVTDPGWPEGFKVYLLDSGISRETAPLVKAYKDLFAESSFAQNIQRQLIPMTEHALHVYLTGSGSLLSDCLSFISQFQREHFQSMIPGKVKDQWDQLASQPGVHVKFCGAGGGVYFLVVSTEQFIDLTAFSLIALN
ncbi:MAG: hypothetical protein ABIQ11_07055 [Saprospiraceae bacterium]